MNPPRSRRSFRGLAVLSFGWVLSAQARPQVENPFRSWTIQEVGKEPVVWQPEGEPERIELPLKKDAVYSTSDLLSVTAGSIEFELSFGLSEDQKSGVTIELKAPLRSDSRLSEDYDLAIDFDPTYGGGRFSFERPATSADQDSLPAERVTKTLTDIPEPPGLCYVLKVHLGAGGGMRVFLLDGTPLIITTEFMGDRWGLKLGTRGPVQALTVSRPRLAPGAVTEEEDLQSIVAGLPRLSARAAATANSRIERVNARLAEELPGTDPDTLGERTAILKNDIATLLGLPEARATVPPEVREVEERNEDGARIEKVLLEWIDGVSVPTIWMSPAESKNRLPLVVQMVGDVSSGKCSPDGMKRALALAKAGALVVTPDLLCCGERLAGEPFDRLHQLEGVLVGKPVAGWMVWELKRLLDAAAERPDADMSRIAVLASGIAVWPALLAAIVEPRVGTLALLDANRLFDASLLLGKNSPAPSLECVPRLLSRITPINLLQAVAPRPMWLDTCPARSREALQKLSEQYHGMRFTVPGSDPSPELLRFLCRCLELENPPGNGTAASEHLRAAPQFTDRYIPELWYSWTLQWAVDRWMRATRPAGAQKLASIVAHDLGVSQSTWQADEARSSQQRGLEEVEIVEAGRDASWRIVRRAGFPSFPVLVFARDLPRPLGLKTLADLAAVRPVVICTGDEGPVSILEQARARLTLSDDALVVVVLPRGSAGFPVSLAEAAAQLWIDQPLLGQALLDLDAFSRTLLQTVPEGHDVQLFGEGSAGILATLYAALGPFTFRKVTTLHTLAEMSYLLTSYEEKRNSDPPGSILSEQPPLWMYVPGGATDLSVEEMLLHLRERGVQCEWLEPLDARRRNLSPYQRYSLWPRLKHLDWRRE